MGVPARPLSEVMADVPRELEALYAAWMRSQKARNLRRRPCAPTRERPAVPATGWSPSAPRSRPDGVRRSDCETWLIHLTETRSASTAKTRHTGMSRFFAFLLDEEESDPIPMDKVRPPAVPEVPVPMLSDDELGRCSATCEGKTYADRRDTAIMRLFFDTGMRRSELANLTSPTSTSTSRSPW